MRRYNDCRDKPREYESKEQGERRAREQNAPTKATKEKIAQYLLFCFISLWKPLIKTLTFKMLCQNTKHYNGLGQHVPS